MVANIAKAHKKEKKLKIKTWYSNRYQLVVIQRNLMLLFTGLSLICVVSGVLFLRFITSSKSLEPYVIEIEKKSGVATIVDQNTSYKYTSDEMMKRYHVNKFIHAFLGYDYDSYKKDNDLVRLLSSSSVYNKFKAVTKPSELGPSTSINVRIKSAKFKGTIVKVRLVMQKIINGVESFSDKEINIRFIFSPSIELSKEDRLLNPLGFQVVKFDITDEIYSF